MLNYNHVIEKMETMCNISKMRGLTYFGKIQFLKTFVVSKLTFISSMAPMPEWVVKKVNSIIYSFLWNSKVNKMKRLASISKFEDGGIEMPDIQSRYCTQNMMWLKRYFSPSFHPWKLHISNVIQSIGGNMVFNNVIHEDIIKTINCVFIKDLLYSWNVYINNHEINPLLNCIWSNSQITTKNGKPLSPDSEIKNQGFNQVCDLYDLETGKVFTWQKLLTKNWKPRQYIQWCSILQSLPKPWALIESQELMNYRPTDIVSTITNFTSSQIYWNYVQIKFEKPTSEMKFSEKYNISPDEWKELYLLPFKTMIDTKSRVFQFKMLHNILYTNDRLFLFHKSNTNICYFCQGDVETNEHLFYECSVVQTLWANLFSIYNCTPVMEKRHILFGYPDAKQTLLNHIIVITKMYIYHTKLNEKSLSVRLLLNKIKTVEVIERRIAERKFKLTSHYNKWNTFIASGANI